MKEKRENSFTTCCFCNKKLSGDALRFYLSGFITFDVEEKEEKALWQEACDEHGVMDRSALPDKDDLRWLEWAAQHRIYPGEGACYEVSEEYTSLFDVDWPSDWDFALIHQNGPSQALIDALKSFTKKDIQWIVWMVDPCSNKDIESVDDLVPDSLQEELFDAVKRGLALAVAEDSEKP
jgi:hypothetical protein